MTKSYFDEYLKGFFGPFKKMVDKRPELADRLLGTLKPVRVDLCLALLEKNYAKIRVMVGRAFESLRDSLSVDDKWTIMYCEQPVSGADWERALPQLAESLSVVLLTDLSRATFNLVVDIAHYAGWIK